ncbi:hypothetical protein ABTA94_03915, partial [Acinetobacter baumannii]
EWVHVQLHQQKGMISLSPPTICNSAIFITWYYKGSGLCIALFSFFYWAMFVISQSLEVIWMLSISVIVYLVMTQIVPELKHIHIGIASNS